MPFEPIPVASAPDIPDIKLEWNERYRGNPKLKKEGVELEFTEEQMVELVKCSADPLYFAINYMKIIHVDRGLVNFEPYPYQYHQIEHVHQNRKSIILQSRQSGKTTGIVAYLLWYILFNDFRRVGILANKQTTSTSIMSRLRLAYLNLPKWMQQGAIEWNKKSIVLENGSQVIAAATSSDSIRGEPLSLLYIDEAAFIKHQVWEEFWSSVFPTISSGKETKVVMVSTANKLNHFYSIYTRAQRGKNDFKPFTVYWQDVPSRDEEWKEEQIRNTSEDQFNQEHGNVFMGSTLTLIGSWKLITLNAADTIEVVGIDKDDPAFKVYEPPVPGHKYIAISDVSRGIGLDSSAVSIIDVTEVPYVQVAVFRSNEISPTDMAPIVVNLAEVYNQAYILIENNDTGIEVVNRVHFDHEYENLLSPITKNRSRYELGVKTTAVTKRVGGSVLKNLIEQDQLIVNDEQTILELSNFIKTTQGYKGDDGWNDDCVMTLLLFAWFTKTDEFKELFEGLYERSDKKNSSEDQPEHMSTQSEEDEPLEFFIDDGIHDPFDDHDDSDAAWIL